MGEIDNSIIIQIPDILTFDGGLLLIPIFDAESQVLNTKKYLVTNYTNTSINKTTKKNYLKSIFELLKR